MKRFIILTILAAAAIPAFAQQSNVISLSLLRPQFRAGSASLDGERFRLGFEGATDFGAGYTHRWDAWSLTIDARNYRVPGNTDFDAGRGSVGTFDVTPIAALVHYRIGRAYAGAGVAHVITGDLRSRDLDAVGVGDISVSDAFTWAVDGGVELPVRGPLTVAIEGRYMPVRVNARAQGQKAELKFDAVTLGASLRWRF